LIKAARFTKLLVSFLLIFTAEGCALVYRLPPQPPLSPEKVNTVVLQIQQQEEKVHSFFSSGRLNLKEGYWEEESHILMAVTKAPRRIKIEITNPWGRPVAHLLLDGQALTVVSFDQRKVYVGEVTPKTMSKVFPGQLDSLMIWDVLRAYPSLRPYHHPASQRADELSLIDDNGKEVEILDLDPEKLHPRLVLFPGLATKLAFAGFQDEEGVIYAQEVTVTHGDVVLAIHHENMVFNKPIPNAIFTLEPPPGFQIADLSTLNQGKGLF
jgi:outer membrane biogenesis lipoprotein LolB